MTDPATSASLPPYPLPSRPASRRTEQLALLADCLLVGVLTSLCSLPLLTAPAAFAIACTVLRGAAEERADARPGRYLRLLARQLRAHPAAEAAAGATLLGGLALMAVDLLLTRTGLPGGTWCAGLLALVALLASGVALRAATTRTAGPSARAGWTAALHAAAERTRTDAGGTVLLSAGAAVCLVTAWTLPPLALVVPGLLAFAAVATEQRPRARSIHNAVTAQAR